jgi:hypothetical protein
LEGIVAETQSYKTVVLTPDQHYEFMMALAARVMYFDKILSGELSPDVRAAFLERKMACVAAHLALVAAA